MSRRHQVTGDLPTLHITTTSRKRRISLWRGCWRWRPHCHQAQTCVSWTPPFPFLQKMPCLFLYCPHLCSSTRLTLRHFLHALRRQTVGWLQTVFFPNHLLTLQINPTSYLQSHAIRWFQTRLNKIGVSHSSQNYRPKNHDPQCSLLYTRIQTSIECMFQVISCWSQI